VNQRSQPNQVVVQLAPKQASNQVPPPVNYAPRPTGPRRSEYPPLPEKLADIFTILLDMNLVPLPKPREEWPEHWDRNRYYRFHRGPGHNTDACFHLRDLVYDMNDQGLIVWSEVRKIIEEKQHNQAQPRPQAEMGIVQNPLPRHPQPQQPQAQVPQPATQPP